jgi:excisionase family DNA binding protein
MEYNILMSVNDLADYLKTPTSWVYSRTRETGPNSIPRLKVGKYIRFRLPDVLAWLERQNKTTNQQL